MTDHEKSLRKWLDSVVSVLFHLSTPRKRAYIFRVLHRAVLRRPKSLESQALLKMHLIYHPVQATIAGLSARLSVGPLSPTGEEKGRWLHLSAPVLT